jgi:hypothetical protein
MAPLLAIVVTKDKNETATCSSGGSITYAVLEWQRDGRRGVPTISVVFC